MAQLRNYLRSNRKRLALSQKEVAFLLGQQDGATVSLYEWFARDPKLETALALEAIFQRPAKELFGGLYQEAERDVAARAKSLLLTIERGKPNRRAELRRQILTNLANRSQNQS